MQTIVNPNIPEYIEKRDCIIIFGLNLKVISPGD